MVLDAGGVECTLGESGFRQVAKATEHRPFLKIRFVIRGRRRFGSRLCKVSLGDRSTKSGPGVLGKLGDCVGKSFEFAVAHACVKFSESMGFALWHGHNQIIRRSSERTVAIIVRGSRG